ncbi:hypothetical protein [Kitasatospora sp. NPDC093679]|uniref:hypothetical protein n=1 Tax=Kitasatospora sp. NPDC093679 TaxID=3154983 RepID=UPI0034387BE1
MMIRVKNARVDLSADRADLYEPLMRSASPSCEGEGAVRLVFQVEALWDWLLRWKCIKHVSTDRYDYLEVDFARALELARTVDGDPQSARAQLGRSARAVLMVAANLVGAEQSSLRNVLYYLEEADMRHVAEAMMFSAGFVDGTVDLWGGEGEDDPRGFGPNSREQQERWEKI